MNPAKQKYLISACIIALVILADQILKIWVKTNMHIGEEINVIGDRIILHFTENPGMAFGMQFGGDTGKLLLSLFRVIAISGLIYYLIYSIKKGENKIFIICLSLIIAGATGNMIDSAFYGMLFSESYGQVAEFMPEGGGYAPFLHGHVVDMFYCPVIQIEELPSWVPFRGGESFEFFRPIFNIADSAITVAVFIIIIFYRKVFAIKTK